MSTDVNSKGMSNASQFAAFIGLLGIAIIVASLVSGYIWKTMTGHSIDQMSADMMKPGYYKASMILQSLFSLMIFFLPVYAFAAICYHKPFKFLGFNARINYKQILLVAAILFVTFFLSGALAELNKILPIPADLALKFKKMEEARQAQESALIQINSFSKFLVSLVVIAFLPALVEETFFRAGMQNLFTRWMKSPWPAIIITSIIFSLIHLSYYGFLVRFALGVIMGAVYYYSGNLWLNILFHFLFNGIQVTLLYLFNFKQVPVKPDIEKGFPVWIGILALAAIIHLFRKFIKISPPLPKEEQEISLNEEPPNS